MSAVVDALTRVAKAHPRRTALIGEHTCLDYRALHAGVMDCAQWLSANGVRSLALALDNGPAWAVLDLATVAAGIPLVPVPEFFSRAQVRHVLRVCGATHLISDRENVTAGAGEANASAHRVTAGTRCQLHTLDTAAPTLTGPVRITFTSGTTGTPRGVCLSVPALEQVCQSLVEVLEVTAADRHLALLPLSTLLENLGGVWTPLLAGATTCLPGQQSVGMYGATGFDAGACLRRIAMHRPSTLIVVPRVLEGLAAAVTPGSSAIATLRFIAVGGAPVSTALLGRATQAGLPVFQGYGLSECASVVAVNTPRANRPGSVGRILPHAQVVIADDGEIHVGGALLDAYLDAGGPRPSADGLWATGDLGRVDADGFLYLEGRRRSMFITAFGRNVAPEWVEAELMAERAVAQAAAFGEGQPRNAAVLVPAGPDFTSLVPSVARANRRLPDYARIGGWVVADEPFTVANGLLSPGGTPQRDAIAVRYETGLDTIFHGGTTHGVL